MLKFLLLLTFERNCQHTSLTDLSCSYGTCLVTFYKWLQSHPGTIITFLWCWLLRHVSGLANIPWVSRHFKCEVLSLAFSYFIFIAVEWMSHFVMAEFKNGPQQTAAAAWIWGNPDLSSCCFPGKFASLLLYSFLLFSLPRNW